MHSKELEFEVVINNLRLREIVKNIDCFIEISINNEPDYTFRTNESTEKTSNINWKTFEKNLKYKCIYEEMSRRFLEIRVN